MSSHDQVVDGILAQCQAAYRDAGAGFNEWCPPPSGTNYNCLIADFQTGTKPLDDGTAKVWLKPVFTILDGEFEGQEFIGDYMEIAPGGKSIFRIKQLARVLNRGDVIDDLSEAYQFLLGTVGSTVEVSVKQNGQYVNKNVVRMVEANTPATAATK